MKRLATTLALLALGVIFSGCAAVPTLSRNEHIVRTAPVPILVQPGRELAAAERAGVDLYYEAAVAGAIPIIRGSRPDAPNPTSPICVCPAPPPRA